MVEGNWIKLSRKIWDCALWSFDNPKYVLAWIDILLLANYKDKKIMFDGAVETIERGSFITSMVKLSERWSMDRRTVKRFLDTLQGDGMVVYESTRKRTIIKVTNYDLYQNFTGTDVASVPDETEPDGDENDAAKVHEKCTTECASETPENTGFAGSDASPDAQLNVQENAQPNAQQNVQRGHNSMYNEDTTDYTQHKNIKEYKENKEGKESNSYCASDDAPQPVKTPKAEIDALFERLWELYPVKKGKGKVSDAKRKALYAIGYEEMERAIDRYLRELSKDADWRKPQHGSTFFNSGYVDYLDKNFVPDAERPTQQKPPPVSYQKQTKADELAAFYEMAAQFGEGG